MPLGTQCNLFLHQSFLNIETANIDLEGIVTKLNSDKQKLEGLNELDEALNNGCSTATFLGQLEKLFTGLRSCLQVEGAQIEVILKVN